jgi:6-phosphogluconolactonase
MSRERLYIGTYTRGTDSQGIYRGSFDTQTGSLDIEASYPADNPSFLAMNATRENLYAVNEVTDFDGRASGAMTSFAIDSDGGLTSLNQRPSEGALPCHLALVMQRYVVVANYGGATVCVFPLSSDGLIDAPSHVCRHEGSGSNPDRQSEPHPHQVVATGDDLVLIPDLGLDRVLCYRLREGRLVPNDPPWAQIAAGSGPRHLIIEPDAKRAYLINEIDNTIDAFEFEPTSGALAHLQRIAALPSGATIRSHCADIHINGHFLYASNRGHDSLVVCAVDAANGLLEVRGHVSTGGGHPRNFCFDPSGRWLLVANRDADNVVAFHMDPVTGIPEPRSEARVPAPVCLLFAESSG